MQAVRDPYRQFKDLYEALLGRLSRTGHKPDDQEVAKLRSRWEAAEAKWSEGTKFYGGTMAAPARPRPWDLVCIDLGIARKSEAPKRPKLGRPSKWTREQIQKVAKLIEDPSLSNREIARLTGVSHQYVGDIRKKRRGR